MQAAFMFTLTASLAGCISASASFAAGEPVLAQSQLHGAALFPSPSRQNAASKDAPRLMRAEQRTKAEVRAHDVSQRIEVKGSGQVLSALDAMRTVTLGGFPTDFNGHDFSMFNGVFVEKTDENHLVASKPTYWEQGNHTFYIFYCKSYDVWGVGAQQFWANNKAGDCMASVTTEVGADILSDAHVKFEFLWDGSKWQKILGPRVSQLGMMATPAVKHSVTTNNSSDWEKILDGDDSEEPEEEKLKDKLDKALNNESTASTTAAPTTNLSAENLTVNETRNNSAAVGPEDVNQSHSVGNLSNKTSKDTTPRTAKEWADALGLTLDPETVNKTTAAPGPTPLPTDAPTPPPTPPTPAPTLMPTLAPSPDGLPYGWKENNTSSNATIGNGSDVNVDSTSTNNTTVTTTAIDVDPHTPTPENSSNSSLHWWNFTGFNETETIKLRPKLVTPTQKIKIA